MDWVQIVMENWGFVAAWGAFYAIGVVMKRSVLSPERAKRLRWVRTVRRWFPLPLHPIVAGIALGRVQGVPLPEWAAAFELGGAFYYGGAGLFSIVWHDIYREWRKHEHGEEVARSEMGISLDDSDLSSGPPPAP
jgi:hypothetical protein